MLDIDEILREASELTGEAGAFDFPAVDTDKIEVALANTVIDARGRTVSAAPRRGAFGDLHEALASGLSEELRRQKLVAAATLKTVQATTAVMSQGLNEAMAQLRATSAYYQSTGENNALSDPQSDTD